MSKSDKELAVEIVIAQIQAAAVIKHDGIHTGTLISVETADRAVQTYYKTLSELGTDKTE